MHRSVSRRPKLPRRIVAQIRLPQQYRRRHSISHPRDIVVSEALRKPDSPRQANRRRHLRSLVGVPQRPHPWKASRPSAVVGPTTPSPAKERNATTHGIQVDMCHSTLSFNAPDGIGTCAICICTCDCVCVCFSLLVDACPLDCSREHCSMYIKGRIKGYM